MINIGIICEGPTDYIILKRAINKISGEDNCFFQLQPEPNLMGEYGNGWKGVWKWCADHALLKEHLMKKLDPVLDILVIQIDGDVSRKEKATHCQCESTICEFKRERNPLECDATKECREACPVKLPCDDHELSAAGYIEHLEKLVQSWIEDVEDVCIVVPCDSTEAWIVAAYDNTEGVERIEDPWTNIISRKKHYHNIRIPGNKKRVRVYEQFADVVCANWKEVTRLYLSAKRFETRILSLKNNLSEVRE